MTFGERLYQQRKAKGFSQEQLAEKLEVSRQAVSKWETGETQPDMPKLLLISNSLGISLDELCGSAAADSGHTEMPPYKKRSPVLPILALAAALLTGFAAGYLAFEREPVSPPPAIAETTPSAAASTADILPENMKISGFRFSMVDSSSEYSTLNVVFSPNISREGLTYTIVKTDGDGDSTVYPAPYTDGVCVCRVTAYYYESFLLTAVVSDGVNTWSTGLIDFYSSPGSLDYNELWNSGS